MLCWQLSLKLYEVGQIYLAHSSTKPLVTSSLHLAICSLALRCIIGCGSPRLMLSTLYFPAPSSSLSPGSIHPCLDWGWAEEEGLRHLRLLPQPDPAAPLLGMGWTNPQVEDPLSPPQMALPWVFDRRLLHRQRVELKMPRPSSQVDSAWSAQQQWRQRLRCS